MRIVLLGVLLLAVAGGVAYWQLSGEAPLVPVERVQRLAFEDQVTTNGRVEPYSWASARAEREGLVQQVPVTKGQKVAAGAVLAVLDSREAERDLQTAQARIEEAQALIQVLSGGGRRTEIVEIEQGILQRRQERDQAKKELGVAERLLAKGAGTKEEVRLAAERVERADLQIAALEARRPVLVGQQDLSSARTRLAEARIAADGARRRMELGVVRAPMAGVVYQLDAKVGSFLTPGALVANVGRTDLLKVIVYVDEPELGKVKQGLPVKITWDALEGKSWQGVVDKTPTQIVPLGTRQVGEVECKLENAGEELLPGTNVNASIQTRNQAGVLQIPKEAMRVKEGVAGVYVVEAGVLVWTKVEFGASNITHVVVAGGIGEGDSVVMGPEAGLKVGGKVRVGGK
jgi:HlyD family secretion protein